MSKKDLQSLAEELKIGEVEKIADTDSVITTVTKKSENLLTIKYLDPENENEVLRMTSQIYSPNHNLEWFDAEFWSINMNGKELENTTYKDIEGGRWSSFKVRADERKLIFEN